MHWMLDCDWFIGVLLFEFEPINIADCTQIFMRNRQRLWKWNRKFLNYLFHSDCSWNYLIDSFSTCRLNVRHSYFQNFPPLFESWKTREIVGGQKIRWTRGIFMPHQFDEKGFDDNSRIGGFSFMSPYIRNRNSVQLQFDEKTIAGISSKFSDQNLDAL